MTTSVHQEVELFKELILATSEHLAIPVSFIEKDYYISRILKALSKSEYKDTIVFKGGTSLSKAYRLINRFSEDVDFAVISEGMSGNKVKELLSDLMKEVTSGLTEDKGFEGTKGNKYRKQAFNYPSVLNSANTTNPILTRLIIEISDFATPFPHEQKEIEPLVTTFLRTQGHTDFIHQYDLDTFTLNVLSLKQTVCEKLVALIRSSMSVDPIVELSKKVRHFYDIDALLDRENLVRYVQQEDFGVDMQHLIQHDQRAFSKPEAWSTLKDIGDAPIINNFEQMWNEKLGSAYEKDLSILAYKSIPSKEQIATTFIDLIKRLQGLRIS